RDPRAQSQNGTWGRTHTGGRWSPGSPSAPSPGGGRAPPPSAEGRGPFRRDPASFAAPPILFERRDTAAPTPAASPPGAPTAARLPPAPGSSGSIHPFDPWDGINSTGIS